MPRLWLWYRRAHLPAVLLHPPISKHWVPPGEAVADGRKTGRIEIPSRHEAFVAGEIDDASGQHSAVAAMQGAVIMMCSDGSGIRAIPALKISLPREIVRGAGRCGRGSEMLRGRYGVGWMIIAWLALATLLAGGLLGAVWLLPMIT